MVTRKRQGAASHTRLSAGSLYIISLRKRGLAGAAGGRRGACGLALSLGGREVSSLKFCLEEDLRAEPLPWSPGLNLSHEEAMGEKANCISVYIPPGESGQMIEYWWCVCVCEKSSPNPYLN